MRNVFNRLRLVISNTVKRFLAVKTKISGMLLPGTRKRATVKHSEYEKLVVLHRRGNPDLNPCPVCWQNLASKNEADEMNCLSCGDLVWNGKDYVKE